MNATVWYVIEIVGFSLAAVFLILEVILFIKLKVPTLVAEISGKRFEKEVKLIRERNMEGNQQSGERRHAGKRNIDIVDILEEKPETVQKESPKDAEDNSTSILSYDTTETMVLSNKTSVLYDSGATSVLNPDKQFQVVRNIIMLHTDERIL